VEFCVRRATADDAEGVAEVYVASWNEGFAHLMRPRAFDREQVARWERDLDTGSVQWWLAERGSAVIGFAGTGPSRDPIESDLGELDTIAVAPSNWRHGVGSRLMERTLDDLAGAGYRQGIVWTLADYPEARKFYEATGWHTSGEVRDAGVQIAMRRPLTNR
jgi:N-acetylglutamate synthase-like GNAT family acetyltransferase